MEFNEFQTQLTDELRAEIGEEIYEQLIDYVTNVEFIRNLVSPSRKRAKDLERDNEGKIIIDFENPHILEDMDYFRQPAIHFQKHGCYTFLAPNSNVHSAYRRFWDEEIRRCRDGYVRESDGEWVTGRMYFFLNYSPIKLTKIQEGRKKASRVTDLPEVWEGIYWRFHYLHKARENGHHAIELARRGCGKSFTLASTMAENLILGEKTEDELGGIKTGGTVTILTAYTKEYLHDKDGTLSKFEPMIYHCFEHTPYPHLMLKNSSNNMIWQMGYKDSNGIERGSLNSVMGVSSKDDEGKLRGKRGNILFEEMGSFPNLLSVYDTVRYGMEEGDYTYGMAYLVGTSAEDESDFSSAKKLLYSPKAYNIQEIKNVYDKPGQGKAEFGFFFPAYINRKGCYNKDGVSDVIKSIIQVLKKRQDIKYEDPGSLARTIAEMPITPAEALIKVKSSFFPTTALTERLEQLDKDPNAFNDVLVGDLFINGKGEVEFKVTNDIPIRQYNVPNSTKGAIEIFELPKKDSNGKVFENRYIMGHDPIDNDQAESSSLSSSFVFDLFEDKIVAEYTGRQDFADDNFEIVRLLCLFYNATCLFESNKKGIYAYFRKMHCDHLLADTPEYLREKNLIKYNAFGSNAKGVNASAPINNYANGLIKDWLLKPVTIQVNGEDVKITMLFTLKNRALIQELINYTPDLNVDRIRSLGMVMLYREAKIILYGGEKQMSLEKRNDAPENDPFFTRNYDDRFVKKSI